MLTHKIRDMEQETFRNRAVKYVSYYDKLIFYNLKEAN